MAMPQQRRWRSEQNVGTPPPLLLAVRELLGGDFAWDLAATADNTVADRWLGPGSSTAEDALLVQWHRLARKPGDWLWLNPPFGTLGPWVAKCAAEAWLGAPIVLLVPAAVGADWFAAYVHGKAEVLALRPRLTFVGHSQPYPKDCMLCVYRPGAVVTASEPFRPWRWRAQTP